MGTMMTTLLSSAVRVPQDRLAPSRRGDFCLDTLAADRCLLCMQRPVHVPSHARWNESDDEWEVGDIVNGVHRGDFTWWRADGTLVGRSPFDDEGRLHGTCRRYHPDRQTSLESRYVHGVRWGKTWHTRSLAGASPEDVHMAALPPTTFRLEMGYVAGGTAPLTTRLNRRGAEAPPETRGGALVDWRSDIGKFDRGTAFSLLGTLRDVNGEPFDGRLLYFDGVDHEGDETERVERLHFTRVAPSAAHDRTRAMGAAGGGLLVSVDEAAQYLLVYVDSLDHRIVGDRPPTPLGMTLEVRQSGLFVDKVESTGRAGRAGLLAGDRVVSMNGTLVTSTLDYVSALRPVAEAQRCAMVIERDGSSSTVTLDLESISAAKMEKQKPGRSYTWYGHASSEGGPVLVAGVGSYGAWRGADADWDEDATYRVQYYGSLVQALDESLRPNGDEVHQEAVVIGAVAARSYVEKLRAETTRLAPAATAHEQQALTAKDTGEKARGDIDAWLPAWRDHMEQGTDFVVAGQVVLHVDVKPYTDYARACAVRGDAGVVSFGPDDAYRALSWDLEGPGTADVARASDGRGFLLLSVVSDEGDEEQSERLARRHASEAARSEENDVGELTFDDGLVAVVWAPVSAMQLGVSGDVVPSLRAAAQLNPPVQLNQRHILGVGTLVRVEPGVYRAYCGDHEAESWSCRWLRLERS